MVGTPALLNVETESWCYKIHRLTHLHTVCRAVQCHRTHCFPSVAAVAMLRHLAHERPEEQNCITQSRGSLGRLLILLGEIVPSIFGR